MLKKPIHCTEDDGYANPYDFVDHMGRLYASEYVAMNQPWIREVPFHEWLERMQAEVKVG